MSKEQYQLRRQRLLDSIDGVCLIFANTEKVRNSDVDYVFRQDSDFLYLTGFEEPHAALLLDSQAPDGSQVTVFLRKRDPEMEIWDGFRLGVDEAPAKLGVDKAEPIEALDQSLTTLLLNRTHLYFALGLAQRADQDRLVLDSLMTANKRKRNDRAVSQISNLSQILHEMRMYKSPEEIERMSQAASLTDLGHRRAMAMTVPGVKEYELQTAMEYEWLSRGSERNAYPSIVGSGPNACILHYRAGRRVCQSGELILIDAGCEFDGYASDVTRTFPVSGTFTPAQASVYEIVLAAQVSAIDKCRVGHTVADIHNEAVRVLVQGLIALQLLTGTVDENIESKAYRRFYMHGTGHWIGMDVHDVGPNERDGESRALEPGMVCTVEPGIYISPDDDTVPEMYRGIGIRIEDDIHITDGAPHNLTAMIPKSIEDVEALVGSAAS
jgi:Xaa-Pro aminopeptidase